MENKFARIADRFLEINRDLTYEQLLNYDRNHEVYELMVRQASFKKRSISKKERKNEKERLYQIVQRNSGNLRGYFERSKSPLNVTENSGSHVQYYTSTPLKDVNANEGLFVTPVKQILRSSFQSTSTPSKKRKVDLIFSDKNEEPSPFSVINVTPQTISVPKAIANIYYETPQSRTDRSLKKYCFSDEKLSFNGSLENQSHHSKQIEFDSLYFTPTQSNTGVLPLGTKNVEPSRHNSILINRTNYKNCSILEGEFLITQEEWAVIYRKGKFLRVQYPTFFKNRLRKYVNNTCNIAFYRCTTLQTCHNILAYCRHNYNKCKNFKFVINKHPNKSGCRNVKVFSTSLNYCHIYKLTDYVQGVSRDIEKNRLLNLKPMKYRSDSVARANKNLIKCGNLQQIKSDTVIRKVRSEARKSLCRDDNDLIDLFLMRTDHPEYVMQVSSPLNVKIVSKEQLKICGNSSDSVLYFDATGTVVRSQFAEKKILYYCGVVIVKNLGKLCPVFEMISCEHDTETIYDLFIRVTRYSVNVGMKLKFNVFVSDFSYATIHAACQAFNNMTLLQYLEMCFYALKTHVSMATKFKRIKLCCAHFMKNVCKHILESVKCSSNTSFFKEIVACAFGLRNFADAEEWASNIFIILCSKFKNDRLFRALEWLKNFVNESSSGQKQEDTKVPQSTDNINCPFIGRKQLRHSSPFFKHFNALYEKIVIECDVDPDATDEPNEFYQVDFALVILNRYIPFLPMWTMLMESAHEKRVSNNPVERFFGILKNDIMLNQKYLSPTTFLRLTRSHVITVFTELSLGIQRNRLASAPKKTEDGDDNVSVVSVTTSVDSAYNAQEEWQRKPCKKPHSYFNTRFLKKINIKKSLSFIPEETEFPSKINNTECVTVNDDVCIDVDASVFDDICELSSNKIRFLKNGLVNLPEYYALLHNNNNLVVCHHSYSAISTEIKCVKLREFNFYHCSSKLDVSVTNFFNFLSSVILRNYGLPRSIIWTVQKSVSVIQEARVISQIPLLQRITYMPLCTLEGEKWGLLKINVSSKTLTYFSPSGAHAIECEEYLRKFLIFLNNYNILKSDFATFKAIDENGWKIEQQMHTLLPPQHYTKGYLAILWYLDRMLSNVELFEDNIDLPAFARKLQVFLLEQSDNVSDNCLICGKCELQNSVAWIQCTACSRWVHYSCEGNSSSDSFSLSNVFYYCLLCSRYFGVVTFTIPVNSLFTNILPNGLFNDTKYYVPSTKMGQYYTVAKHSLNHGVLTIEDYALLNGEQYLSNVLLDHCIQLLYNQKSLDNSYVKNFLILPSKTSELMLYHPDDLSKDFFMALPDFTKKVIVIPILRHQHFTLLVVNMLQFTYSYLDPLRGSHNSEIIFTKFQKFLKLYNSFRQISLTTYGFQKSNINQCYQKDSFNCGIYVIFYVNSLLSGTALDEEIKPNEYRVFLQTLLIRSSENMTNLCIECAGNLGEKFLKCVVCLRGTHVLCLKEKWPKPNTCHLCHEFC